MDPSLQTGLQDVAGALRQAEEITRHLMRHPDLNPATSTTAYRSEPSPIGEIKANIMLAVRHIEDARTRLELAINHADEAPI